MAEACLIKNGRINQNIGHKKAPVRWHRMGNNWGFLRLLKEQYFSFLIFNLYYPVPKDATKLRNKSEPPKHFSIIFQNN